MEERLLLRILAGNGDGVRSEAVRSLRGMLGEDGMFVFAERAGIASVVGHALMGANDVADEQLRWSREHRTAEQRVSRLLGDLDRMATLLASQDIPVVLLENGAIARAVYPCHGCFSFHDLDLLVLRRDLERVHRFLLSDGYRSHGQEPRAPGAQRGCGSVIADRGRLEYVKTADEGFELQLNVQLSLVARRWFGSISEETATEMMDRSQPVADSAVRMLAPEDNLIQLALHSASHAYVRSPGISLHLDLERFLRSVPVDWQVFLQRTSKLGTRTAAYFALAIPAALFETPVPAHVLDALRPPRWKERLLAGWIRRAGLFSPHERKFSRAGYILFNALLYDDLCGLWRALFPERAWMRERYGVRRDLLLPYYHARRLFDLSFRRLST